MRKKEGNQEKNRIFYFAFFCFAFCFFLKKEMVPAKGLEIQVNEKGDIFWVYETTKASTSVRWRTQGFLILLEETEYGYPLGKDNKKKIPYLKLEIKRSKIKVVNTPSGNGKWKVENTIEGNEIKKLILNHKVFYDTLRKKMRENKNTHIFINGYYQTYRIIDNSTVEKAFKNKEKSPYKERFQNGYYKDRGIVYDYDEKRGKVLEILKENLYHVDQIENAHSWIHKEEWRKKENRHYNYPVNVKIGSNLFIKLVDENENLIGRALKNQEEIGKVKEFLEKNPEFREIKKKGKRKKEKFKRVMIKDGVSLTETWNPRAGFSILGFEAFSLQKKRKRVGEKGRLYLPAVLFSLEEEKEFHLVGCYFYDENCEKRYIKEQKEGGKKGKRFFETEIDFEIKTIYGEYRKKDKLEKEEVMEGYGILHPFGEIRAGTIEHSPFDVEKGIPGSEFCFKRVRAEEYLLNYRFRKIVGTKTYPAISKIRWNLTWKENVGKGKVKKVVKKRRSETRQYVTMITRPYSYWKIDRLEYYILAGANIENKALKDGKGQILPTAYKAPSLLVSQFEEDIHIRPPKELKEVIDLGNKEVNGKSIPFFDPSSGVEHLVGEVLVKNDRLILDAEMVMNDKECLGKTPHPISPRTSGKLCGEKTLYRSGLQIPPTLSNDTYLSRGKVFYVLKESIFPENEEVLELELGEINGIKVHTPVVCDVVFQDAKEWCQLLEPNYACFQLVLTKNFTIESFSKGRHLPIKGYGVNDYEKYTKKKEVIFPFDVLESGNLIPAGVPISIFHKTSFTLPAFVKEGIYTVQIRNQALNAEREGRREHFANLDSFFDTAIREIEVEVSGRLFDFTLEKVKHSSLWEGNFSRMGRKDGLRLFDLPMVEGEHPFYENMGDFKKGYALQIAVTTIGSYIEELYGVEMDLRFFVYDKNFQRRIPVDVYYEAVSEEEKKWTGLIKVGSSADRQNLHFYEKNGKKIPMFCYDKILMPKLFLKEGSTEEIQRWRAEYSLPARLYVCKKGFDLEAYVKRTSVIVFNEDFWIREGKLVVSADIYSLKGGRKHLGYRNQKNRNKGYLNNWEYETRSREKWRRGKKIFFREGEIFVFDLAQTIWQERLSRVWRVH